MVTHIIILHMLLEFGLTICGIYNFGYNFDWRRSSAYYTTEALIGKSYLLGEHRSDLVEERLRAVEEKGDEIAVFVYPRDEESRRRCDPDSMISIYSINDARNDGIPS